MKAYIKLTILIAITLASLALGLAGCKESGSSDNTPPSAFTPPPPSELWTITTPAGITVITAKSTIAQYESLYGYWGNIDWEALDALFEARKSYYCGQDSLNWDCKDTTPSQVTVHIKPWDSRCKDEETPTQPKEIYVFLNGKWQCIDGWYWVRVVYFHLGDDPGWDHILILNEDPLISMDYYAFQESAYEHELMHFFQEMAGLPFSDEAYMGNVLAGSPLAATVTIQQVNPPKADDTPEMTMDECLTQAKEFYPEMPDQQVADNCFYIVTALDTNDKSLCKNLSEGFVSFCEQQFH